MNDRFGLSWRPDLAAGVFAHRDRIDCIEVIADDWAGADAGKQRALAALARELPVSLHSIALGPASTAAVDAARLRKLARLVERVRPESWSEHLAFVRAGRIEIGHLAAPPRNANTVEGALANLAAIERVTGRAPAVENIATLIHPPGSTMSEPEWLGAILGQCRNPWLLDLHNVWSNALNFGFDARAFLDALPLDGVSTIHIAGGRWIRNPEGLRRYLDDHLHPVPDPVFALLAHVAARARGPLTVILERDGRFPPMPEMLAELDLARRAVNEGRRSRDLAAV